MKIRLSEEVTNKLDHSGLSQRAQLTRKNWFKRLEVNLPRHLALTPPIKSFHKIRMEWTLQKQPTIRNLEI